MKEWLENAKRELKGLQTIWNWKKDIVNWVEVEMEEQRLQGEEIMLQYKRECI